MGRRAENYRGVTKYISVKTLQIRAFQGSLNISCIVFPLYSEFSCIFSFKFSEGKNGAKYSA